MHPKPPKKNKAMLSYIFFDAMPRDLVKTSNEINHVALMMKLIF